MAKKKLIKEEKVDTKIVELKPKKDEITPGPVGKKVSIKNDVISAVAAIVLKFSNKEIGISDLEEMYDFIDFPEKAEVDYEVQALDMAVDCGEVLANNIVAVCSDGQAKRIRGRRERYYRSLLSQGKLTKDELVGKITRILAGKI